MITPAASVKPNGPRFYKTFIERTQRYSRSWYDFAVSVDHKRGAGLRPRRRPSGRRGSHPTPVHCAAFQLVYELSENALSRSKRRRNYLSSRVVGNPSVIEVLFLFRRTRRITDARPVLQAQSVEKTKIHLTPNRFRPESIRWIEAILRSLTMVVGDRVRYTIT